MNAPVINDLWAAVEPLLLECEKLNSGRPLSTNACWRATLLRRAVSMGDVAPAQDKVEVTVQRDLVSWRDRLHTSGQRGLFLPC